MNTTLCPLCHAALNAEITAIEQTVLTARDGLQRRTRGPVLVVFCTRCEYASDVR